MQAVETYIGTQCKPNPKSERILASLQGTVVPQPELCLVMLKDLVPCEDLEDMRNYWCPVRSRVLLHILDPA